MTKQLYGQNTIKQLNIHYPNMDDGPILWFSLAI